MRIGVLRNPLSTKNLKNPRWDFPGDIFLVETSEDKSISEATTELARENLDLLVIDGGDGTITSTLSTFVSQGISLPPIGFIANGNTNLIARKTGTPLTLENLVSLTAMPVEALQDKLHPMPVLNIAIEGQETRCGFIAGWGAYAQGTRMAVEEMRSRHDLQIVAAIFATLRRSLFGAEARTLRDGIECQFQAESIEPIHGVRRFVGLVTSFKGRLAAGVKPFWGTGTGAIRWLDVIAPPRYHILLTPFVLFGLALPILESLGYRSGRTSRVSVTLSDEIIIDGEIISLPPNTRIDIDADRQIDILHI